MKKAKNILIASFSLLIILFISLSFISQNNKSEELHETVIFTSINADESPFNQNKFPTGAKIWAYNLEEEPVLLTSDFHSARSPMVSYDAKMLLFAGQKAAGDKWQIWEMDLDNFEYRQITNRLVNCTDPAYLPNGKIVYSSSTAQFDKIEHVMVLYTIHADGTGEKQITFHPNQDQSSTILRDGRILTNTHQIYPDKGNLIQLVLRTDGTKGEMYHKPSSNSTYISRGWETGNGQFVYIEKYASGLTELVSIDQNRPLHSKVSLLMDENQVLKDVYPSIENNVLLSMLSKEDISFGLYELNNLGEEPILLYSNEAYHITEPMLVQERSLPKILPSRIVEGPESGTFLCLNINETADSLPTDLQSINAYSVEVFTLDNSLGSARVSEDGSFYIEVPSNEPLRFQSFNEYGELIQGPSAWMWVRPKERRGCIGCHENKELAPENRVPLAVKTKPIDLTKKLNSLDTELSGE